MYLEYLQTAKTAALAAGSILMEKLGHVGYREKNPADLVTEADELAQKKIVEILLSRWPDHYFIGEEAIGGRCLREEECGSGSPADLPLTWIIDPLDGTTNFVHQVPFFATSIALCRGNEILCGVIYNPVINECFTAVQGEGAFLNDRRIQTSGIVRPEESLASFSLAPGAKAESPEFLGFLKLLPYNQALRRTGSTALNLAYISAGRFDAAYCLTAHPWDVAAGVLLLQESGASFCSPSGDAFELNRPKILAAASRKLLDQYLFYLNQ